MSEIKCPECGHRFELTASDYDNIASQVRNAEFEKEVQNRMKLVEDSYKAQMSAKVESAKLEAVGELQRQLSDSKQRETMLEGKLSLAESKIELAVLQAVESQKTKDAVERQRLQTELDYYKDLKTRMSTKMVGETLEQHCQIQFNQIRAAVFPNA